MPTRVERNSQLVKKRLTAGVEILTCRTHIKDWC
jgi:hypothetical protein